MADESEQQVQPPVASVITATPVAVPWYESKIMRGIVAGVVAQIISRVQSRYHFDLSVFGLSVNDVVSGAMDAITAIAVAYTARARVNQTATPAIVLSKPQAAAINETARVQTLDAQKMQALQTENQELKDGKK